MQKKIPLYALSNVSPDILLSPIACLMFLAVSFFIAGPASAQQLIKGQVIDAETRGPLPSANVQIDGTFKGTITNVDGYFSLQVQTLPATLVFRYIGYESQRINVTDDNIEVALKPVIYSLDEVVVTEDDPAIEIMRKVIEHKQVWRAQMASYAAEAYNRFTLKNDTGIVSIIESFTDTYWDPVEGTREIVKARRQTSNLDISEYLPAAQFVANLYDDNIDIAGYNFMGITHPNALSHYIFELHGYRRIDDQVVYDIQVRPRNKLKTGFVGKIAVLDEEYALLEVSLHPGDAFLFPPPIEAFDVTFEQQYSNFGEAFWLPVDFRSSMQLDIGFSKLLTFPSFFIEQVSRLSNYDVNATAPDTLFAEGEKVAVDSVSVAEDTLLDQEGIAVPLNKAEATAYESIDSTMTIAKAYEPRGPLAKAVKVSARNSDTDDEVALSGEGGGGKKLDLDLRPLLRFNRVEGLYGELGLVQPVGKRIRLDVGIGYSVALNEPAYKAGARIYLDRKDRLGLLLNVARYTDTQTSSTPVLRAFNGIVALFEGVDYFDYYANTRYSTTLRYDIPRADMSVHAGVQFEDHNSLKKETDYDLFGGNFIQRENPESNDGKVNAVVAGVTIGETEETGGLTGRRYISLQVEHASPSLLDSWYSFTTYELEAEWRVNTFFKRRLLPNVLDLKIVAQTSTGDVPAQRLGAVDGRISYFNRFGTLKTLQDKPYRGEDVIGLFWEHNFKTVPFELLGMRRVAENAINLIVFGGHAQTSLSFRREDGLIVDTENWHHEVGVSLSGLFSLLRVDFAFRVDEPGFSIGIGSARIF